MSAKTKLDKSFDKLNKVVKEIKENYLECAKEFGVDIKYKVAQEYDDNNYFNELAIQSYGNLHDLEIKNWHLDDGTWQVIEFIKTLEPSNAVDFITEGKSTLRSIVGSRSEEIEEFAADFDYGSDLVNLIVECIKEGHSLEKIEKDIIPFLEDVVNADSKYLPEEWEC